MSRPAAPRVPHDTTGLPLGPLPRGLRPGDRVALLVPGTELLLEAVLALLANGVVPAPLDPRLSDHERREVLRGVDPTLVVEETEDLADLLAGIAPGHRDGLPRCRPMHCTSGTTGVPKGVWSGLLPVAGARALLDEERAAWGFRADDVNLVLSPLYHSAPLRFAVGTRLAGGRVVVPGPFDPAEATAAIAAERPTTMFCVPAQLQRLFAHWDEVGTPDLSCFRLVAHAGAPCPEAVKRRLVADFPAGSTWEFYGSTEGQFTVCRSEEWLERPGTLGRARPGRRLEVDPDGTLWCVPPAHGRFVYHGDPEKTARAWRETPHGPAFSVGDLGRIDRDGYLYLDGRRVDLVITGGVNVYPLEVERALLELPGVEDVAVYGVPDERWGQRVCAVVVGDVPDEELAAWARERLAPPKRPKEYAHVAALPRTATGKVRRDRLGPAQHEGPATSR